MKIRSKQVVAGVLALTAAYVGFRAQFATHGSGDAGREMTR